MEEPAEDLCSNSAGPPSYPLWQQQKGGYRLFLVHSLVCPGLGHHPICNRYHGRTHSSHSIIQYMEGWMKDLLHHPDQEEGEADMWRRGQGARPGRTSSAKILLCLWLCLCGTGNVWWIPPWPWWCFGLIMFGNWGCPARSVGKGKTAGNLHHQTSQHGLGKDCGCLGNRRGIFLKGLVPWSFCIVI